MRRSIRMRQRRKSSRFLQSQRRKGNHRMHISYSPDLLQLWLNQVSGSITFIHFGFHKYQLAAISDMSSPVSATPRSLNPSLLPCYPTVPQLSDDLSAYGTIVRPPSYDEATAVDSRHSVSKNARFVAFSQKRSSISEDPSGRGPSSVSGARLCIREEQTRPFVRRRSALVLQESALRTGRGLCRSIHSGGK